MKTITDDQIETLLEIGSCLISHVTSLRTALAKLHTVTTEILKQEYK